MWCDWGMSCWPLLTLFDISGYGQPWFQHWLTSYYYLNQYSINWTSWTLSNTVQRELNRNTIIIFQETHLKMFPANCQYLFTVWVCCLRDWSRLGGSNGNNTQVICCPAPGRPHRTTNHSGVDAITPHQPWSMSIITWLNNFVSNVFTAKYVQNLHLIEWSRLLASIVT